MKRKINELFVGIVVLAIIGWIITGLVIGGGVIYEIMLVLFIGTVIGTIIGGFVGFKSIQIID